jgi:hypothetical protein
MTATDTRTIHIIRRGDLHASTAEGDTQGHRRGPAPPSYGLQDLTGNRARAIAGNLPESGLNAFRPPVDTVIGEDGPLGMGTGWHFHTCSLQLAFIVGGSIEIAYSDDQWKRYYAGEILVIPNHAPHNARKPTKDYGLIELTFPGDFGTTPCEPHPQGEPEAAEVVDDAKVRSCADGVCDYALMPHVARVANIRLIKGGNGAVSLPPGRGMAITVVTTGRCEVDAQGSRSALGPFDMVLDDARAERTRLLNRSAHFRAYQVQLPA